MAGIIGWFVVILAAVWIFVGGLTFTQVDHLEAKMDTHIDVLSDKVDRMEDGVHQRFDALDQKLDALPERLTDIANSLSNSINTKEK